MPLAGIKTFITFVCLQPTSDRNLRRINATLKKGHRVQTAQHPGYVFHLPDQLLLREHTLNSEN